MRSRLTLIALSVAVALLSLVLVPGLAPTSARAQTPEPTATSTPIPGDAYEPDELDPPWIAEGERQARSFEPEGDVDGARLYVKAGHWYAVWTEDLGPLVDTLLVVEVAGVAYEDDDGGAEPLASKVVFQAAADGEALVAVTNRQGVYGPAQSYTLVAGETAAPTPTPTATLPPTATPVPTQPPRPTATPPKPIVAFSVTPDRLDKPGDCATLRWAVDRASEVFLVLPNGNQQGVEGLGELQVCPLQTSEYLLKVNAPGGDCLLYTSPSPRD